MSWWRSRLDLRASARESSRKGSRGSGGPLDQSWGHPPVRAEPPAEAGAGWPRKDNDHDGLERPDSACRSGSARARGQAALFEADHLSFTSSSFQKGSNP